MENAIDKLDPMPRAPLVKGIDACHATFLELLPPLHASLQAMVHPTLHCDLGTDWSWDGETITQANSFFLASILNFLGSLLHVYLID